MLYKLLNGETVAENPAYLIVDYEEQTIKLFVYREQSIISSALRRAIIKMYRQAGADADVENFSYLNGDAKSVLASPTWINDDLVIYY